MFQNIEQRDDIEASTGKGELMSIGLEEEGAKNGFLTEGVAADIAPKGLISAVSGFRRQVTESASDIEQSSLRTKSLEQAQPGSPIRMSRSVSLRRVSAGNTEIVIPVIEILAAVATSQSGLFHGYNSAPRFAGRLRSILPKFRRIVTRPPGFPKIRSLTTPEDSYFPVKIGLSSLSESDIIAI